MNKIICNGCGAVLQTEDETKEGFIKTIDTSKTTLYCKRCFRLMNYNEYPKITATNDDYVYVIDNLLKKDGLIVLVVDLFDFTGTFIPQILNKLRNKDVILVANKLDLLPRSVNISNIVTWLSQMVDRYFFKALAIHVVSSKTGYYIDELMNTIDIARNGKDVYFMGCANVGKSSLINMLIKRFSARKKDLIATSPIPGTTLKEINIPFFIDNKSFIDTPGLINLNNAFSNLSEKSYDLLVPKKEIKPISYQIEVGNCVLLGAIFSASLKEADGFVTFTSYVSENVSVHRRKDKDLVEFINKHKGEILVPPAKDDTTELQFDIKTIKIGAKRQDLVISGLGFITINKPCTIEINYLRGLDVFLRNAIFGSKN